MLIIGFKYGSQQMIIQYCIVTKGWGEYILTSFFLVSCVWLSVFDSFSLTCLFLCCVCVFLLILMSFSHIQRNISIWFYAASVTVKEIYWAVLCIMQLWFFFCHECLKEPCDTCMLDFLGVSNCFMSHYTFISLPVKELGKKLHTFVENNVCQ